MTLNFSDVRDLMLTDSEEYARIMAAGILDNAHMFLELPDNFDLGRTGLKPAAKGLGDWVASIAQPIARAIDGALGTDLVNCGECAKRKEFLNNL